MAGFQGIAAVGLSIERLLNACFKQFPPVGEGATAALVDTEAFKKKGQAGSAIPQRGVSVFLHRVAANSAMRPAWSAVGSRDGRGHLPLDLHFLLTPWATNAEDEMRILGRTMQCLEAHPILSGPMLHPSGEWDAGEVIQVVLDDLAPEDVMRTFDALRHAYKLSVSYVTRVVRIDTNAIPLTDVVTAVMRLTPTSEP